MTDVISLERVDVWLGGRHVLDGVGFTVGAGEVAGLIGPNGAGKTTLFRVILGLQPVAGGSVTVEGHPVGRRARPRPRVGYVPQRVPLDPDTPLRARDLVSLGVDGDRYGLRLPSRRRDQVVDDLMAAVGATAFADARVGTLSGGEQQRVLIAHALATRPQVLLMDEPLANLDLASAQDVVALVAQVSKEHGVAVLVSAHDVNALLPVMDRVVYVARGRVASGPPDEVVRDEVLRDLYGHPVRVLEVGGRVVVVAGEPGSEEMVHG